MNGLAGKTALVTGANSETGQAIAVRLAREGCNVVINYGRKIEEGKYTEKLVLQAADEAGNSVQTLLVQGDISKEDDIVRMVNIAIERFGSLDVLVEQRRNSFCISFA
ncbi:SDR family NAD(P)-dependent oxidoreductase [Microcoleus sp. FACHB-1515]|uniref:SDR family NAD(P)-dependent oxidoreductase n=1 Tax=Cyanophyceae TaxID=3028117 RepID=UPI001681C777|nr:SDR family NAD(P)-dependent oxidoreductase [Microcoleus sp. FACHB-1515]MBD2089831.1 SDR family NAD(P)-dependent oxidoreductase [Microcoleus sp. FACHB-1515]